MRGLAPVLTREIAPELGPVAPHAATALLEAARKNDGLGRLGRSSKSTLEAFSYAGAHVAIEVAAMHAMIDLGSGVGGDAQR